MKNKNFLVILTIIAFIFILTLAAFLFFEKNPIVYTYFIKSNKDYSQKYKEAYDDALNPLHPSVYLSVILNEKEMKEEEKIVDKIIKKDCPEWQTCPLSKITNYILSKESLDINFDVNKNDQLKNKVENSYKEAKNNHKNFNLAPVLLTAHYANLISENDKNFWLKTFIEEGSSDKESPSQKIILMNFYLDIKNINDLKDKITNEYFDIEQLKKNEFINGLCKEIKTPNTLTKEDKFKRIENVWSYLSIKDFCQIPRTVEDQKLLDKIGKENYLSLIKINNITDINFYKEMKKYYTLNSDKIFKNYNN